MAHEDNTRPDNLVWNCRACNTRLGVVFKRLGLGRRTHQYNPAAEGAKSPGQWLTAVTSMKGEVSDMPVSDVVAMIRATTACAKRLYSRAGFTVAK